MEAVVERIQARNQLAKENIAAWLAVGTSTDNAKLDSSLKRHSSLIKKLKAQLNAESLPSILKDIRSLKLEKYLSEIAQSILESRLKTSSDISAAILVISTIHQRFPNEFVPLIAEPALKILAPPPTEYPKAASEEQQERDENARISKQRPMLRLITEMWMVGLLDPGLVFGITIPSCNSRGANITLNNSSSVVGSSKTKTKSEGVYIELLHSLFAKDPQHFNLPLAVAYLKTYGEDITGVLKRQSNSSSSAADDEPTSSSSSSSLSLPAGTDSNAPNTPNALSSTQFPIPTRLDIPQQHTDSIRNLFINYFNTLTSRLKSEHHKLQQMARANRESLFNRGSLPEGREEKYTKTLSVYEKLYSFAEIVSDYLYTSIPVPKTIEIPEDEDGLGILGFGTGGEEKVFEDVVWDDEESKQFYEDIIDLKDVVPGVVLGLDDKKTVGDGKEEGLVEDGPVKDGDQEKDDAKNKEEKDDFDENADAREDDTADMEFVDDQEYDEEEDEEEEDTGVTLEMAQFQGLCDKLAAAVSIKLIDDLAVEFCYACHNYKSFRKRIIKALLYVPRNRLDLLPFWSRFIATLAPYFPHIPTEIISGLEKKFRYHMYQRAATTISMEERIRVVRYLGELVKFRICPLHTVFHAIKRLVENFVGVNVDVATQLLETAGRYLYRRPETTARMEKVLEILEKKKQVMNFDQRQIMMIDNAIVVCKPPSQPAMVKKERTIMDLYIRKLLYVDLGKNQEDKILRQLRKLNWDDSTTKGLLKKYFTKSWKIKFSQVQEFAYLASELARYHPDFGVFVVDAVLEEIKIGLERNMFKHNTRRLNTVVYLGELYNYRLVKATLIFDVLYMILMFGHEGGHARPDSICPIDMPTDFFRVRLVCALLDVCGDFFDRGITAKKLDTFLTYLQMYVHTKTSPSLDIEFILEELFEKLRPNIRIYDTYAEAAEAFTTMWTTQLKLSLDSGGDGDDDKDENKDDQDGSRSNIGGEDERDENENQDEQQEQDAEEDGNDEEGNDEEEVIVYTEEPEINQEEEDEFKREMAKVIQESLESRKYVGKSGTFDLAVPMLRKNASLSGLGGSLSPASSGPNMESPLSAASEQPEDSSPIQPANGETDKAVAFTVLVKKGHKPLARTVNVPQDSDLVTRMRQKVEAEEEEKSQLKRLVLQQVERATAEELSGAQSQTPQHANQATLRPGRGRGRGRGGRGRGFNRRGGTVRVLYKFGGGAGDYI